MKQAAAISPGRLFNAAVDVYEQGDVPRALQMLEDILHAHPGHSGALFMSGSLLLARGQAASALPRLTAAAQQLPDNGEVLQTLGDAYFQLERWQDAASIYGAALQAKRRNPGLLNNLGMALHELGDLDGAIVTYRDGLSLAPDDADLHNNLANALNSRHDYAAAMAAYQRAAELNPDNPSIWSNLAMLYEQSNMLEEAQEAVGRGLKLMPDLAHLQLIAARYERRQGDLAAGVARLKAQLARGDLSPKVRRTMEFELGRMYDAQGEVDSAYSHFLIGNRLTDEVWPTQRASADEFMSELRRRKAFFDSGVALDWAASPLETRGGPVFLVGFARSGTTLLDTMLSAHPDVDVLEEQPMLNVVIAEIQRLTGSYPEGLAALDPAQIIKLRELYWRGAESRLSGTPRKLLLDKNPFASAHAGLIKFIFPSARFIFALRHPCDVVLSCFMQGFGDNPALGNFRDLQSGAELYRLVMDLWNQSQRFGLDVHVTRYEALVDDKEGELRGLLEFLGLSWEEGMQDHTHQARKRGRIYTPSYHQVVRPVYRDALARWQRYRKYYGEALEILGPYVKDFDYSLD
ncbi:MAG TPA: sulfotransferase [Gammaproteobacteria bacterium]|nr:sulfotransferase [Gammaproteobacteria bacterium]